jgi:hypothetical protein
MEERIQKLEECWRQYKEGAITFYEYVCRVQESVTQEDVDQHNEMVAG